jgi:hypothetical protein
MFCSDVEASAALRQYAQGDGFGQPRIPTLSPFDRAMVLLDGRESGTSARLDRPKRVRHSFGPFTDAWQYPSVE